MNLPFAKYLTDKTWLISMLFYLVLACLITVIFAYGVFAFKTSVYNKKIAEMVEKISAYTTPEEKAQEKKVFEYKKKIDAFAAIINNHKISSNVFSFIEGFTLPNVWFSSLNMAESNNELRLVGETENMETLSKQFNVFENNKEYVKDITVLNSQVGPSGRINFILNISLEPKIFGYVQAQNGIQ